MSIGSLNKLTKEYPSYVCVQIHKDDVLAKAEDLELKFTDEEADKIAQEICDNYQIDSGFWMNIECWLQDHYETNFEERLSI
jgi:hypothetical protein